MKLKRHDPTCGQHFYWWECDCNEQNGPVMKRKMNRSVTIEVPHGYKTTDEFLKDCGFKRSVSNTLADQLEAARVEELARLKKMQNELGHDERDRMWQGGRVSGLTLALTFVNAVPPEKECAICGERDYPTRWCRCERPDCPPQASSLDSEIQVSYELARRDNDLTVATITRVFENGFKVLAHFQGSDAEAFIDAWNSPHKLFPLHFDSAWLEAKIKTDSDIETDNK